MNGKLKRRLLCGAAMALVASYANASPVLDAANGHYYEFVSGYFTWDEAKSGAESLSYNGNKGYLATSTSSAENGFIYSLVQGTDQMAWLGASDAAQQGSWKWLTGPEAGTSVSYANWASGEPNNYANNEKFLQINYSSPSWTGLNLHYHDQWNDYSGSERIGYVVEFSAPVPEPETYALLATGLFAIGFISRKRKAS